MNRWEGATRLESRNESETADLGRQLAETLPPGSVVCLDGDLGTGKTVFARGMAIGFGVREPVTSPTFTLVNSYEGRLPDGSRRVLHHFDLYRIMDPEELPGIGWDEYFDGEAVCLVEWPGNAGCLLPAENLLVRIMRVAGHDDHRVISVATGGGGD